MQFAKLLLLIAAALTATAVGRAAAQEFAAVAASPNCTASTVTVDARSDIECAVKCSQVSSSLSYSFISGVCVLSDRPDCAAPRAEKVFQTAVSVPKASSPSYALQQVGGRQFWVFQQRQTGQVAFDRTWAEYEQGFGSDTEFWSGLLQIHEFTRCHNSTLRVEMTTVDGTFYAAEWPNFTVADVSTNYTMTCGAMISGSSNISCDAMAYHSGMQFSTMERDNDAYSTSCSALKGCGGFWYRSCYLLNPNALHPSSSTSTDTFVYICSQCVESYKKLRAVRMMLQT